MGHCRRLPVGLYRFFPLLLRSREHRRGRRARRHADYLYVTDINYVRVDHAKRGADGVDYAERRVIGVDYAEHPRNPHREPDSAANAWHVAHADSDDAAVLRFVGFPLRAVDTGGDSLLLYRRVAVVRRVAVGVPERDSAARRADAALARGRRRGALPP